MRGIAEDYAKVKAAVYERYSGIKNMNRLTPVFDIQREMRASGLRAQLNLPVVYYELAVSEAVTNIKTNWSRIKDKIRQEIRDRENLTADERKYMRTILKIDSVYWAVLNRRNYEMPQNMQGIEIDAHRLNNLLCRLTRKFLVKPKVRGANQFKVTPAGYKYKDGGIYLVSRLPRRRIFLPLKDTLVTNRQIRINIDDNRARIQIPVDVDTKENNSADSVYIYVGYKDALTLSNGHIYGKGLENLVTPETERLNAKNRERSKVRMFSERQAEAGEYAKAERIVKNNLGKKKYEAQKSRAREQTQNYINTEINRMIEDENPGRIFIAKPALKKRVKSFVKAINRGYARSFAGYIRRRLAEKCRVLGIDFVMVGVRDARKICSKCGAEGICDREGFHCASCGYKDTPANNAAVNIEKAALEMEKI